jgi:hypothetical protein
MKNNRPRRIVIIIFLFVVTTEHYIQCPGIRIIMLLDCRVGNTVGRGDCYEFASSQTFEISCWRNRSRGTGLGRTGLEEPVCWRNRSRGTGLGNLVSKSRSQGTGLLAEPVWGTGLEEPVCETCL